MSPRDPRRRVGTARRRWPIPSRGLARTARTERSAPTPSARFAPTSAIYTKWCNRRGEEPLPSNRENRGRVHRRDGRAPGAGDGAPLRRQHHRRAPRHRVARGRMKNPAGGACAQAHGPAIRAGARARRRGSPGRCGSACIEAAGRPAHRRAQPRARCRRLRRACSGEAELVSLQVDDCHSKK